MENKIYTIKEISNETGLSRKEIRKHLIAQTIKNSRVSSGYEINIEEFENWKGNIPEIDNEQLDSHFNDAISLDSNFIECKEKDISSMYFTDQWQNKNTDGIKFANLFCGAGGLSLGLIMAGYEPVLGVEINNSAYETYQKNIGSIYEKINAFPAMDITVQENKTKIIEYLKKEDVKLLCGGFPCQGFSLSGSRVISDPRNTLYLDMLEIVKDVKPDFIVMENVVGITTIFGGKVLKKIISDYKDIGYDVSWKELNAADYEVAQSRKRIIFIGNRVNKDNVFPKPIITDPNNYITCGDVLSKYEEWDECPEKNHIFSKHSEEMKRRLAAVEVGKSLYPGYNDAWKKSPADKPSCTIKGNHGATNIHYKFPRVISPREMAALQSFPDNYIFYGNKQSQLVQIGNAVAPYVSRAIGLALKEEILRKVK